MPHNDAWHILDNNFADRNQGLTTPTRVLWATPNGPLQVCRSETQADLYNQIGTHEVKLKITNLDRSDPTNYRVDSVPRNRAFNRNVFLITAEPRMPRIEVECETLGFDPALTPILWRLQCRHVLCRHAPQGNYRYRGACDILEDEWQGESTTNRFTLFDTSSSTTLRYIYNSNNPDGPAMGGHAILSVAASPVGIPATLLDYVHLRIGGTNPADTDVLRYIDNALSDRDANIIYMLRAIFAHESNFTQFSTRTQTSTGMTFRQRHHQNDATQPDCLVRFDWPDDPPNYPLATFDFGVGISQYTRIRGRTISREVAWDWRENLKIGINLFLGILRAQHQAGLTWQQWALRAWRPYNGSGPQAQQYAQTLVNSTEGQRVSNALVPNGLDVNAQTAALPDPPARSAPPTWPSPGVCKAP